jgi:membrane protease YdiL (CAAX protease family)
MNRDQKRLALFCTVTFGFSWIYWLAVLASARHRIDYRVPLTPLGAFGPALGALVTAAVMGGRSEIGRLLRRLRTRGITWRGIGLALVAWPALVAIAIGAAGFGGAQLSVAPQLSLAVVALSFIEILIFTAAGEELGWRGYALPILLDRTRPDVASIIVGSIWAVWHLPLFWIPGTAQAAIPFGYFALAVIASSFVYTAVFRLTAPSVIAVMLLHTIADVSLSIAQIGWPQATDGAVFWFTYLGVLVLTGAAIAIHLARSRRPMSTADVGRGCDDRRAQ